MLSSLPSLQAQFTCLSHGCLASGDESWFACTQDIDSCGTQSSYCQDDFCGCSVCSGPIPCGCINGDGCTTTGPGWSCAGERKRCTSLQTCSAHPKICTKCLACNILALQKDNEPITGILAKPQSTADHSKMVRYAFVPRDGVFEREEKGSRLSAEPPLSWRLYTYSDGKFVLQHFVGEFSQPITTIIWDGERRTSVIPNISSTMSYYEGDPHWGLRQVGLLVSLEGTHEKTDLAADRSLLEIPPYYTERTPSEINAVRAAMEGEAIPDCEKSSEWELDATYFSYQVKKPFVYRRPKDSPDGPDVLYAVYTMGTIVRTETKGTETKTILYDASHGLKRVLDSATKSVQTYPWTRQDTVLWRTVTGIPAKFAPRGEFNVAAEELAMQIPEGYVERLPSETHHAYMLLTGNSGDVNPKIVDADYLAGQEVFKKRGVSCAQKPAIK
jgi:hypothetical protein